MVAYVQVAQTSDIPAGSGKVIEAGGKTLAVFNCDGTLYATDNTCVHRGGPLGEGSLSGMVVTCPWHGWEFDMTSGKSTMNPNATLETLLVKVEGDNVFVATG